MFTSVKEWHRLSSRNRPILVNDELEWRNAVRQAFVPHEPPVLGPDWQTSSFWFFIFAAGN